MFATGSHESREKTQLLKVKHCYIPDFLPVFSSSALIRREWKSRYDRVMKAVGSPAVPDSGDLEGTVAELVTQEQATTPKRKPGSERVTSCPPDCSHDASLPSDVLIEMKVCCIRDNKKDNKPYFCLNFL